MARQRGGEEGNDWLAAEERLGRAFRRMVDECDSLPRGLPPVLDRDDVERVFRRVLHRQARLHKRC